MELAVARSEPALRLTEPNLSSPSAQAPASSSPPGTEGSFRQIGRDAICGAPVCERKQRSETTCMSPEGGGQPHTAAAWTFPTLGNPGGREADHLLQSLISWVKQ